MKQGDVMEVWNAGGWRRCVVGRRSAYSHHRFGGVNREYYFDPLPQRDPETGVQPSTGGCCDERYFRPLGVSPGGAQK